MAKEALLKISEFMLTFSGVSLEKQTIFRSFRVLIAICSMIFTVGLNIVGVYTQWESIVSLGNIETVPIYTRVMLHICFYFLHRSEIQELLVKVQQFVQDQQDDQEFIKDINRMSKIILLLFRIYTCICFATVIFYSIDALGQGKYIFQIYEICDPSYTVCYASTFIYTILSFWLVMSVAFGIEYLYVYLILAICCEFKMVNHFLGKVNLEENPEESVKLLHYAIKNHSNVLSVADDMQAVFKEITLVHYLTAVFSICFSCFLMTLNGIPPSLEDLLQYGSSAMAFFLQICVYSIGGQAITDYADSVRDAAYATDWWCRTQPGVRKTITLLIHRAQVPTTLSAGGIIDLKYENILETVKLGFSFTTLMQSINERRN